MTDDNNNYTNDIENVIKPKKSLKKVLFIVIAVILFFIGFLYVITEYIPEQNNIKEYINESYEAADEISIKITKGEYSIAINMINRYEEKYSDGAWSDKYYKKLPEEMRAENICPQYLGVIVQTLDKNINESLSKLSSYTFNRNDKATVSAIVNGLGALNSEYPNGVTYTTENGEELVYDIGKMHNEYYYSFRCEEIILDYRTSDKSTKHYEISNMMGLAATDNLNTRLKSRVSSQLAKMKAENRATDFAVTGGSSEVGLMKNYNGEYVKNYTWTCPLCGYEGGAAGMPYDITANGHYIGEKETLNRMMICAGRWVGGCGEMSTYTIEITYK